VWLEIERSTRKEGQVQKSCSFPLLPTPSAQQKGRRCPGGSGMRRPCLAFTTHPLRPVPLLLAHHRRPEEEHILLTSRAVAVGASYLKEMPQIRGGQCPSLSYYRLGMWIWVGGAEISPPCCSGITLLSFLAISSGWISSL
jgi:hypothetical protein